MVDPNFITDMMGLLSWVLAVIAIHWVLKEPFKARRKQIREYFVGRLKWFKSLSAFKQAYLIVACIIGIPLSILFIALCIHILLIEWIELGKLDSTVRNLAIAFVGTISGIGALFGVYLAILRSEENKRQNDTAEQGLITDRINKAVEGLGKINQEGTPVLEVRLGALYALERIAKDSERDHVQIVEIFCAYIRTNSPNNDEIKKQKNIRDDIQEALSIIGRRETWSKDTSRIKIEQAQGMRINLYQCYLERAELQSTNLFDANLYKTNLKNAWFNNADISHVRFEDAELDGAKFTQAKTNMAFALNADFSKCINLTQKQLDVMYCGKDVKIPKMDGKKKMTRPKHWPTDDLSYNDFMEAYYKWKRTK